MYVIAITDKSTKQSRFEIYSFRQTGLIQDQYRIKNTESGAQSRLSEATGMSNGQSRQSVVEILNSPINISRKNTFFSSIPETKDLKNTAEIRLASQFSEQNSSKGLQLEKLLASEEHPFKINAMTYCTEYDMLSVGLSNGQIVNYTFEIESFAYTSGTDTSISPQDQRPKPRCK